MIKYMPKTVALFLSVQVLFTVFIKLKEEFRSHIVASKLWTVLQTHV